MQSENQDVCVSVPDRYELYLESKRRIGRGSGGKVLPETRNTSQDIRQLNQPTHSNDRVYGAEGISPTLNTMQGGRRQPFIKAITRGRSTEPWKEGEVAPSRRIGDKDDIRVVQDCRIRRLTERECAKLMSWPPDWCKYGDFDGEIKEISSTQQYKMCGNGVVSEVVKHVVKELIL